MKYIFTLLVFLFCQVVTAQSNELAIQAYKDAEEAFNIGKYENALSNLDIAEAMLKTTNPKIQGLRLKSYKQLALADSTKHFSIYSAYVTELQTKKSDLANDAVFELANFSKEKAFFLEKKKNSLINPIEKITIGDSFSTLLKQSYDMIDFENPKDENLVLRYSRKANIPEEQIGLYEIEVDKKTDRIIKITTILNYLTSSQEINKLDINGLYNEKFAKFDPGMVSSETQIEKRNNKEYKKVITRAKIDDNTLYFLNFYNLNNMSYKDMKKGRISFFFTEGYEIK